MKTSHPLSREALDEFKAIYREEFQEDVSDDEAREIGLRLLNLLKLLLQSQSDLSEK